MRISKRLFSILACGIILSLSISVSMPLYGQGKKKSTARKESVTVKKTSPASSGKKKSVPEKKRGGKKTSSKSVSAPAPGVSSSEIKKQQQAAENEIRETRRKISENDKAVKANLNDLRKIGEDIEASKKQIDDISAQVGSLDADINELEQDIVSNEAEVARLRGAYLKAVKKMRLNRSGNSRMAFLFSSKTFNEGLRRFRYMKKFSAWKDRQTAEISAKVNELKKNRELLASAKSEKNRVLIKEIRVKDNLSAQQRQKDALVADLRANGAALQAHLSKKQQEANALKSQVSALIAQEEKAARERKAKEEAEQRAKAERIAAEQRRAEEARAREEREAAEKEKQDKKSNDAGKNKKTPVQTDTKKKSDTKQQEKRKSENKDYAKARNRKSRSENDAKVTSPAPQTPKEPVKPVDTSGNFEGAKGRLPHPCSGSFRIVSPFGRHAVPGLPDVVYDNPGIDAETSAGSSAQAVYAGKVSGVYVVPGYSTVIIVSHGNYYTVYGNIASPSVKTGDNVKAGQTLGKLAKDTEDNTTKIHFEVWKNRTKLNPSEWIR